MEGEIETDDKPISAAVEIDYNDYEDPYDPNNHAEVSTYNLIVYWFCSSFCHVVS